jgi:2-polyprenyl-6-methoxyphenol hydroxylase-like FAD-dependent oxidoreductase
MDTDVLIVGAGPTGLMTAVQLVRRGVRVRIIDRHAGPARESRALGVHARTLEIYSHLGIAGRAIELGRPGTGVNLWARGRKMVRVPFGEAGKELTPYPFVLVLGQDDNERLLGEHLGRLGVRVHWNTELVNLGQHADHVEATVKQSDGTRQALRASWVAGCDGAHSSVRELNGIGFPGAPYEHVFFVADVIATGGMVPGEVNVYLWRDGFHLMFPMRGEDHWRLVGIVPPELRGEKQVGFEAVIPSVQKELGPALDVRSCAWFSTYRISHRAAERFRDRRCFLLGDAAHIHSPVGAQGMNTGLQDAYNLAWKLALVVAKQADAALLDTYHDERFPVAQRLLNTTDSGFRLIVSDSWLAGVTRTDILARIAAAAMKRAPIQRRAFRTLSQIGITYRGSPLCAGELPESAPQAGDRFPWLRVRWNAGDPVADIFPKLDDRRWTLLVLGQEASGAGLPASDGSLQVHVLPRNPENDAELARVGIPLPSFYLIRPDGHVGFCGERFSGSDIAAYLGRIRDLIPGRSASAGSPASA